jgi:hypothetical protein
LHGFRVAHYTRNPRLVSFLTAHELRYRTLAFTLMLVAVFMLVMAAIAIDGMPHPIGIVAQVFAGVTGIGGLTFL